MAGGSGADDGLLAEQIGYYRAGAGEYIDLRWEYFDGHRTEPGLDELAVAVEEFAPRGDVLELACGPGTWTPQLLAHAATVTALDASPEMLTFARERVAADRDRVRFVEADLFSWQPERRWDTVFMGFWISHVPRARFAEFWRLVDRCLEPGGLVGFVDDFYRSDDELIEGAGSSTIQRRLRDGTAHRAVKVPHTPEGLQDELSALGWDIVVRPTRGIFCWGAGGRTLS